MAKEHEQAALAALEIARSLRRGLLRDLVAMTEFEGSEQLVARILAAQSLVEALKRAHDDEQDARKAFRE